jgi:hypothetical protein
MAQQLAAAFADGSPAAAASSRAPAAGLDPIVAADESSDPLAALLERHSAAVDPLARITMDVATTTAEERGLILRSANSFCGRDPDEPPPPSLPIALGGFELQDPGGAPGTLRFADSNQVGHWVADVRARPYARGPRSVRFRIELSSDRGESWSAPVAVDC